MDGTIGDDYPTIELLRGPWKAHLSELLSLPRDFLLIASPFITHPVARWVSERVTEGPSGGRLRILCLTNLRVESVLAGSLELEGLLQLGRSFSGFHPFHLPSLHAKVFVADQARAIVTSGNLTHGGLSRNCEYGVEIRSPELVQKIRRDFESYARLGAPLSVADIEGLAEDLMDLRAEYQVRERRAAREAGIRFRRKLKKVEDDVLRLRARGISNQSIFCNTIEHLLSKGPLTTIELHPLIQQIHPDLCDDGVDRVIDGVSFGKKWKHHVRTAQQALKRAGMISFDGTRWHLA